MCSKDCRHSQQSASDSLLVRYEQSDWGWSEREKREELTDSRAWYLLARTPEGKPVAFSHFRFDIEEGDEVLYWSV